MTVTASTPPADAIRVDSTLVTWVTTNPDTGEQEGHYAFIPEPEPEPEPAVPFCRSTLAKVLLALAVVFAALPLLPVTAPVGVVAFVVWRRRRAART